MATTATLPSDITYQATKNIVNAVEYYTELRDKDKEQLMRQVEIEVLRAHIDANAAAQKEI